MKILVFENEYESVRRSFETANLIFFNRTLEIEVVVSSQKADFTILQLYSAIFIDIDLSSKSDLDGYSLIHKISSINKELLKRIVILTGNNKITEMLRDQRIPTESIQILNKPSNYEEISQSINNAIKANNINP